MSYSKEGEGTLPLFLTAAIIWLGGLIASDVVALKTFFLPLSGILVVLTLRLIRKFHQTYLVYLLIFLVSWLHGFESMHAAQGEASADFFPEADFIWEVTLLTAEIATLEGENESGILSAEARAKAVWSEDGEAQQNLWQGKKLRLVVVGNALAWLTDKTLYPGEILRVKGHLVSPKNLADPGVIDLKRLYRHEGLCGKLVVSKGPILILPPSPTLFSQFNFYFARIRADLARNLTENFSFEQSELLKALLLGMQRNLSTESRQAFQRAGVAHLLAISGSHVAMLAFLIYEASLYLLFRFRWLNARLNPQVFAFWAISPVLLVYTLLTGSPPSAVRVLLMLMLYLWARSQGWGINGLNILGFVALLTMIADPAVIWQISWQLSFAAVLAILLGAQRLALSWPLIEEPAVGEPQSYWPRILRYLLGLIWMTVWATLGTLPLVIYYFAQVSWLGLLGNLFFAPLLTFLILPLLFSTIPLFMLADAFKPFAFIFLALCKINWIAAAFHLAWCKVFLNYLGSRPISYWKVPYLSGGELLLMGGFIFLGFFYVRQRLWKFTIIMLTCALLIDVSWRAVCFRRENQQFWAEFLDVGHGDAICLHFPGGKNFLIDGGGLYGSSFDLGQYLWMPYLRFRGIRQIDDLLVTHPHPDHFKGFISLIGAIPIKAFWFNPQESRDEEWQEFVEDIRQAKISILTIGEIPQQQIYPQATLRCLSLGKNPLWTKKGTAVNNRSIVCRVEVYRRTLLFTGDIEAWAEKEILQIWPDLTEKPLTLLKVPHHGSKTSSSLTFLEQLRPQIAVVSAGHIGRNHLPHPLIEARYHALHIPLFKTEDCGALRLEINSKSVVSLSSFNHRCAYENLQP